MIPPKFICLAGVVAAFGVTLSVQAEDVVVLSDDFNVTSTVDGLNLNEGFNTGINPPTTRLQGTAAAGLYYGRLTSDTRIFSITDYKGRVNKGGQGCRFTLTSQSPTAAFDFSSALGANLASSAQPLIYELGIGMANNASAARFSFALTSQSGTASAWDFGIQIWNNGGKYGIQKRIKKSSCGLANDLDATITTAVTAGNEINFLIRITDAGVQSGSAFNSRVQVSRNGGTSWLYDTATDPDLAGTGWRFSAGPRYVLWDIPANDGYVTIDNLKVTKRGIAPAAPAPQTITRIPGGSAKIAIADLGLAPGVTVANVTNSANATITKDDNYIYYTPKPGFDNAETFIYTVSNGTLENVGRITANVVNPGGTAQSIDYSSGSVSIRFAAIPGLIYDVQRATAVQPIESDWSLVETITIPDDGIYSFTDPAPPAGQAFYRLKQH